MDRLSTLLNHFSLHAGVFYTGNICGTYVYSADPVRGHVHLVKRGPVRVIGERSGVIDITEPSVLFLPRPDTHRLVTDTRVGADVFCATIQFGEGGGNPVNDSLPDVVLVKLIDLPKVTELLDIVFDEAFAEHPGRQAVLDRLCEVLMIRLLRHCMALGVVRGGTLAGLADERLAKVLSDIHEHPSRERSLEEMAAMAGMSRARFAARFREITGETPADYVASWRISVAQPLLKRGLQLKHVAGDVSYGSASAFSRAFVRKMGCSPTDWLKRQL